MPLVFPPSPSQGTTYTDDNSVVWQFDGVKWNVVTGTTKKLYNGVRLGFSINYSLTTTLTAVDWDVEAIDTAGYFTSSQPSKITIPATGYYDINLSVFSSAAGAGYEIQLLKNDATELSHVIINPNQASNYDETQFFNQGDYLEVLAKESSGGGSLTTGTYIQLTLMGLALGTGVSSYSAFSGVRTNLSTPFATTTTPTAISWTGTDFDTNADALALTYWSAGTPGRITIKTNGYYEINVFVETATAGATYTLTLRKNGSTVISTTTLAPNDTATLSQVFQLNANDYLELMASETTGSGSITAESHFEVIRMGV